ncbi:MAG: hypothetical protein U9R17_10045 [Thermodesulfobacteriota bacterium]|nr:hypothetical protein [Thermodesulfobacteriota bacterium]
MSVKEIYENDKVRLSEPLFSKKRAKVIVTILEEPEQIEAENFKVDINIFEELVGVVAAREDGSIKHGHYSSLKILPSIHGLQE